MSSRALQKLEPEGLPFERRPEDSELGWALYLQWLEAPSDMTVANWAEHNLSTSEREVVLNESLYNQWTKRKMAYYRHVAEITSCHAASKAAKTALRVIARWEQILDRLTDDLQEDKRNYTDAEIERLRVVGEGVERILKATTGNKFVTAIVLQNNNNFGRRPNEGPPVLGEGWNPTVIEQDA
jgi:hypothetical protein